MEEIKVQETLQAIRKRLRLAMNGVIASSMREKGMQYKLIFGVPFPEIRQIASGFEPDADLAEALWQADVRELKLLATMLYPASQFRLITAQCWITEIPYMEVAEQAARFLYARMSESDEALLRLLYNRKAPFARSVSFLALMHRMAAGETIQHNLFNAFWIESIRSLTSASFQASWNEKQAALKALKQYERQSEEQARRVLLELAYLRQSDQPELREIYEDLHFEWEYTWGFHK